MNTTNEEQPAYVNFFERMTEWGATVTPMRFRNAEIFENYMENKSPSELVSEAIRVLSFASMILDGMASGDKDLNGEGRVEVTKEVNRMIGEASKRLETALSRVNASAE